MSVAEPQPAAVPPKRRWHQYSLRTLLLLPVLLALVLSAVYSWPLAKRRYFLWRLSDYLDQDLRKLHVKEMSFIDEWVANLTDAKSDPRYKPGVSKEFFCATRRHNWT